MKHLSVEYSNVTHITTPNPDIGVKQLPLFENRLFVDNTHSDTTIEPRPEIASLKPHDKIKILDKETYITSVCKDIQKGTEHVIEIGLPPSALGTVATLTVDRSPYIIDAPNGNVYTIPPQEVTPISSPSQTITND